MCGIFGYTGYRSATPLLLDGLASLEYRGYDSAGICLAPTNGRDGIHVVRAAGDGRRMLVLTPEVPVRRSEGGRLLRSVGPGGLFDVIKLYDAADLTRLGGYGAGGSVEPGFWSAEEIAATDTG